MTATTPQLITASPVVAGFSAYKVARHGAPVELKLDQNEGDSPAPSLFRRLAEIGPDVMRRYPSTSELEALLARRFGVDPQKVIVTAGADDALDRLCRAVLAPGRRLLCTNPTFEMMLRYARIAGGDIDEVEWWEGPFPTEAFLAAIRPETALVAVVTPNNPTGTAVTRADLERLVDAAPHALLLLDHAYVEFADEDFTDYALSLPNAVVVRTLSKAWGLAGLRTGYALSSNEEFIRWMRVAGSPYSVARPSIALAAARLEAEHGEMEAFVSQVKAERHQFEKTLAHLGVGYVPSQGNFVFIRDRRAFWMRDALAGLGIATRVYPGREGLGESLRISCPGDPAAAGQVVHALEAAIKPGALIFHAENIPLLKQERDAVRRLCARFPVCLLSEPGRTEAQQLVEQHDFAKDIRIVYTISSTGTGIPLGPTLRHLGVDHGWFVGTNPQSLRVARAAWLVPIGYIYAGSPAEARRVELTEVGAARVLDRLSLLEDILP